MPEIKVSYTGATPGADANTYVLFSTVASGWGKNWLPMHGISLFTLDLNNPQAGTINAYRSEDRGTNWIQESTQDIAASGATSTNILEFVVEGMADLKLEWVNGGSAQTAWSPTMWMTTERAVSP